MKRKRISRTSLGNFSTYAMVAVAFLILQIMVKSGGISSSLKGQLVPICAYVVMAISLNLTVGVLGELSLGHAGFMSVGAFSGVVAAMSLQSAIPFAPLRLAVAMVVGALCAGVAGFLIGIPVLRLKGDYLAIVTLAFGEIIKSIINNLYVGLDSRGLHFAMLKSIEALNLEAGGKVLINGPMGISGIQKISTFTGGIVLILVTLFIVFNLVNSRAGRAIMAVRDNRIAAESVGINITKYKMIAFVTSAALAGAAGTLFSMSFSTVVANKFDFNTSILILVFVVLGGLGKMWGSILAAAALTVLPELLRQFSEYRMLVYAIVLILVMLATNNETLKSFFARGGAKLKRWLTPDRVKLDQILQQQRPDGEGDSKHE
ncbi:MAG: branched-chain amino acid ABC transporter permease [Pseudoflavonifractor sp.]